MIIKFLKNLFDNPNDPVKHCEVYLDKKNGSCVHVDGMHCDFPTCSIRSNYLAEKEAKKNEVPAAPTRVITGQQSTKMSFDPVTGEENPTPCDASMYRAYHGQIAWLHNPWTGKKRHPLDIGSDVTGLLIIPPNETVKAG